MEMSRVLVSGRSRSSRDCIRVGHIIGFFQLMLAIGVMLSYFINCASFLCPP